MRYGQWAETACPRETAQLDVNGLSLEAGDGAAVSDEARLEIQAGERAELLIFDLA